VSPEVVIVALISFTLAIAATWLARKSALRRGLLDVPNARSSHTAPVPRGGGLGIVFAGTMGWLILYLQNQIELELFLALAGGGSVIAVVGYIDDLRDVPARVRLCVHFAAALWALFWLDGFTALAFTGDPLVDQWIGRVVSLFAIVWTLNLFNFMDGIDGLASSEAVFVAAAGALLTGAGSSGVGGAAWVFAASSAGFLCWNWPPAKIFMGDVGSGFLGYCIAVLALAASHQASWAMPVWLILGGVFFVDATVTLFRRLLRRERFDQAHRSHAYQWLTRRWRGHRPVTAAVVLLNMLVLLPIAIAAARYPGWAFPLCGLALAMLVALALIAGAGKAER
jgi:Fuc2NAc and GlcNAc transferase